MTVRKIIVALLSVVAISMTGCMSSGIKVSDDKIATLQENVTTKKEVLESFGNPTSTHKNSTGTSMLIYSHIAAQANTASYIPIVGIFAGGANSTANHVFLYFDQHDVLTNYETTSSDHDVSTGLISD